MIIESIMIYSADTVTMEKLDYILYHNSQSYAHFTPSCIILSCLGCYDIFCCMVGLFLQNP
jgi:hypothetical protein